MIRKILVRDYLKGYGDMTADERRAFVGRVGEWLVSDGARLLAMTDRPLARSQSLMTITTRWTSEDCRAMAEGISLLSAMVAVADTWLPTQIYMRSAYRAVRQVYIILNSLVGVGVKGKADGLNVAINPITGAPMPKTNNTTTSGRGKATGRRPEAGNAAAPYNQEPKRAAGAGAGKPQALPSVAVAKRNTKNTETTEKVGSGVAGVNGTERTVADGQPQNPGPSRNVASVNINTSGGIQPSSGMVPARPKHIDQYVHLLPKATQERAAGYGELMRQLGEARDNMQLLMDDDHASAKSREQWAKQATKLDKKIRAIRDELDQEWKKVAESGRVVIDDLGMAHLVPTSQCDAALNSDGAGDNGTATDCEGGEREPVELTSEQKKRRRDLRKWLIDLRRGKEGKDRERRIEQWRVNWKEYLTLEPKEKALEDEKILEAAKHFGIDIGGNTDEHGTQDADEK